MSRPEVVCKGDVHHIGDGDEPLLNGLLRGPNLLDLTFEFICVVPVILQLRLLQRMKVG
ncbi:MAG: hypothetical protein ACO3JL_13950 [Myxococcota bacterium]